MANRVTIQDIADALGVSRNTVSKAINDTGILADATREKILKKAAEMGYKQFAHLIPADSGRMALMPPALDKKGEIVLFTTVFWARSSYVSALVETFQKKLSQQGYGLTMHRILHEEVERMELPQAFDPERTSGIICFELFDDRYCQMICGLGLPVLFTDAPVHSTGAPLAADLLFADDRSAICAFVKEMARRGKKKIGFVGEYLHSLSFFQRYMSYRTAMCLSGLPCLEDHCILGNKEGVRYPDSTDYQEYLTEQLRSMKSLPEVFICANDFVAVDLLQVMKKQGIFVPADLYLCGFDDAPETRVVTPALTTVRIDSESMGTTAFHLLLSRIKDPSLAFRMVYVGTKLVFRDSTEDPSV